MSRVDLEAEQEKVDDFTTQVHAKARVVAERVHVVLGLEHADESMPRYELRRAVDDLLEEF